MSKNRRRIPSKISSAVMYNSAHTCVVCRIPTAPVQIHHIDQNPSNNDEGNLVVVCQNCHDEAHTKRSMSKNLTPELLKIYKEEWENEVKERSSFAMTSSANLGQAIWTYINHQRLPDIFRSRGIKFDQNMLNFLISKGVVDSNGIPIFQKNASSYHPLVTIYDRFDWDDGHRLHRLYTDAVNELIVRSCPIELGAIWSKQEIRDLVSPGTLCFCMRGFRFKSGDRVDREEDRLVYARAKGIEVTGRVNTRHMFGSSALHDSFTGNRFAAMLALVKDVANENGMLVVRITPLAMGAGFVTWAYHTPMPLKYGWVRYHGQASSEQQSHDIF